MVVADNRRPCVLKLCSSTLIIEQLHKNIKTNKQKNPMHEGPQPHDLVFWAFKLDLGPSSYAFLNLSGK